MHRAARALQIGFAAFLSFFVGALPLHASTPSPQSLLATSATVMDRVPSLRVTGTVRQTARRHTSRFYASGACDASSVPARDRTSPGVGLDYLRIRVHVWGALHGSVDNARYIVIGSGKMPRTWMRSSRTHGRWELDRTEGAGYFPTDTCSILFMSTSGVPTNTPTRYSLLGQMTLGGVPVWHVRMRVNPPGERWRYDWYIDVRSSRVLRQVTALGDSGGQQVTTYSYSRFGMPVHITAPSG